MGAKIPQNVTKEDKLVGPLTLKQFLYILGAGLLEFIAYQYYSLQYLYLVEFLIISFLLIGLALAFAFVQINGRPFAVFAASAFRFFTLNKQQIWAKQPAAELPTIAVHDASLKHPKIEASERVNGKEFKSQIEKLAGILDTGGTINPEHYDAVTSIRSLEQTAAKPSEAGLDVEDILTDTD